jgi:hypothetical protein
MRRTLTALAATLTLVLATLGLTAGTANAYSFGAQGPPHEHYAPCGPGDCNRYILANGHVIIANGERLVGSYGYVLVLCSTRNAAGTWVKVTYTYGPFGNTGNHPYCTSPTYNGVAWAVRQIN